MSAKGLGGLDKNSKKVMEKPKKKKSLFSRGKD